MSGVILILRMLKASLPQRSALPSAMAQEQRAELRILQRQRPGRSSRCSRNIRAAASMTTPERARQISMLVVLSSRYSDAGQ